MLKKDLRSGLTTLALFTLCAVIVIWALFFSVISRTIYQASERQTELLADRIIAELDREFADMERLSRFLSGEETVRAFALEGDISRRLALAGDTAEILTGSRYNPAFAGDIVLYDQNGVYYRLAGQLSNTACSRMLRLLEETELPGHLVLDTGEGKYIGYADGVRGTAGGQVVILVEEERLRTLLRSYLSDDALYVSVSANGVPVTELGAGSAWRPTGENGGDIGYIASRHVGITPFEITVAAPEAYLRASLRYFSAAALVTAAVIIGVILLSSRILNRRFFAPMVAVMQNMKILGASDAPAKLPPVDNEAFDALVATINDMLARLEQSARAVQVAQLQAKNAEIQRQRSEINTLKKQINAHFTINTLTSMKILIGQGRYSEASGIAGDLSSLIRYAYDKSELINMWDEFQTLRQYIDIMNVRYDGKITAHFDIDDRLMDVFMPRMFLQPLVENAILHGFRDRASPYTLWISAFREGGDARIIIRDDGRGMPESDFLALQQKLQLDGSGDLSGIDHIAMLNVQRRLRYHYGQGGALSLDRPGDTGFAVTLFLPKVTTPPRQSGNEEAL
ncbi:histidine kinase [Oscillospiraceae bacterium OttesenSCG-928-F05]|nr:histidine kinase [Oscillospiraceae bacterium OttesenSCG-928-F05]